MVGVVLRQNPLTLRIRRSDPNPSNLCSSFDQTLFPIRTPFNLCISTSTTLPSALSTESLPETSQTNNSQLAVSLFQSYGFSDDQIQSVMTRNPTILSPQNIKKKIDYVLSFGFSTDELVRLVLADPQLLSFSLKNRITYNLNFLLDLLGSKELLKKALFREAKLIRWNMDKYVMPNVETLRANGVPTKRIIQVVIRFPRIITHKPDAIVEVVKEVKNLGIDPSLRAFIVAMEAKITLPQSVWDRKVELYKSLGWSDANFMAAFTKLPHCMLNSEAKIKKIIEFYVNKLGWDPVFLSEQPLYIGLSLEKRVIPRCAVLEILASRGLLEGESELHRIFVWHHSLFEAKFVSNYKKSIPDVVEAYKTREAGEYAALRSWQERTTQTATKPRNSCGTAS